MPNLRKTLRKIVGLKNKKVTATRKNSSGRNSSGRKSSSSGIEGTKPTGETIQSLRRRFKKTLGKQVDIENLSKQVEDVSVAAKQTFQKTRKSKRSPTSPIVATIRNLNTGKAVEAVVVKNLDTGKYEFFEV